MALLIQAQVAALEEQQKDTEENSDDETKATGIDTNTAKPTSKSDSHYGNLDINDIPMEENQKKLESFQRKCCDGWNRPLPTLAQN